MKTFRALAFISCIVTSIMFQVPASAADHDYVIYDHATILGSYENMHIGGGNPISYIGQIVGYDFLNEKNLHGPVKVTEYFNYYCPHCYKLENALTNWVKARGHNIEFVRAPVASGNKQLWPFNAYYSVLDSMPDQKATSALDRTHLAIFKMAQDKKVVLTTADEYIDFYISFGIEFDKDEFRESFDISSGDHVSFALSRTRTAFHNLPDTDSIPTLVIEDVFLRRDYIISGQAPEMMLSTATFLVNKIMSRSYEDALNDLPTEARWILPKIHEYNAKKAARAR